MSLPLTFSPFAPGDTVDLADPVITQIATRLGITPAAVCLKWAIGRGQVPIPFSVKRPHYLSTLRAAVSEPLSADDMAALARPVGRERRDYGVKIHVINGTASGRKRRKVPLRGTGTQFLAPRSGASWPQAD